MTDSEKPKLTAPANTCDCHVHVYEAGAPIVPQASMPAPEWATLEAYEAVRRRLGTSRAIFVQPTVYGTDNSVVLNAIENFSGDARGIAVVDKSVTEAELKRLTDGGVRGVRFQMLPGGVLPWEDFEPIVERVAAHGWHVQLQMDGRLLGEREALLKRLPCPLVIDHVGKFLEPVGVDHDGFKTLLRLLEGGRTWMKLCAAYETSKVGAPLFEDVGVLAKAAAKAAPERMVWASNWPHVSVKGTLPDDAMLLDILLDWIPDQSRRDAALAGNAGALYGFTS